MTTVNVSALLSLDESHSIVYALVNTAEEKADKKYLDVATHFTTQAGNGLDEYFQGLIDELGLDYVPSSVAPVGVTDPVAAEPVIEPSPVVEPVATEAPAPIEVPVVTEPSPVVEPVVEPSLVVTETPAPVEAPVTEPTPSTETVG